MSKPKTQIILETIKKIEAVSLHLESLLKVEMYSVEPMIREVRKHKEIIDRIYEGR